MITSATGAKPRLLSQHYDLRLNNTRKHCANKVHRLRSVLKMTHGKGRDFKQLPAITVQNVKDGQYVTRHINRFDAD